MRKPRRKFTPPASATPLPLHSHTSQPHNTSAPLPTASRASLPSHSRRPPQPSLPISMLVPRSPQSPHNPSVRGGEDYVHLRTDTNKRTHTHTDDNEDTDDNEAFEKIPTVGRPKGAAPPFPPTASAQPNFLTTLASGLGLMASSSSSPAKRLGKAP